MNIDQSIIERFEQRLGRALTVDLKNYLLTSYAKDPFPYVYSEQDLHENISKDIKTYYAGNLDTSIKSSTECWEEERERLLNMFKDKVSEIRNLTEYIERLENLLSNHNLVLPQENGPKVDF